MTRVGRLLAVVLVSLFLAPEFGRATVTVSADVAANTTWSGNEVYLVTRVINVVAGVTLTVQPGAVVKFQGGAGIAVNQGALYAVGSATEPIVFTSYRDDTAGGDTNGDGASTGRPGDWREIAFNGAAASSRLEKVEVR